MSTIDRAPLSYFIYSSLSFFANERGGELPGMWFVRALTELGREAAAVRQTLYRMEADGELESRREGRVKYYRASRYARAEIDEGIRKLFAATKREWDGSWTLVSIQIAPSAQRDRVVALLAVMGFALFGHDVYLHPHDVTGELRDALPETVRSRVIIMRAPLANTEASSSVLKLWRVPELAHRYLKAINHLEAMAKRVEAGITTADAFRLRFDIVFTYLGVAWDDPELPSEALPSDWPAERARTLAARLYRRLLPAATRHADALLKRAASPAAMER